MPLLLVKNDITRLTVDAIVNAAAPDLLGGGGVDGAIHAAAGPGLLEECRGLGGCETGMAKITGAYGLDAKYVIHTVGPIWHGGTRGEKELLISCYRESLRLAKGHGCTSVAFPLISSGVFGYPKKDAFRIASDTISEFLKENDMTVYIVVFGRGDYGIGEDDELRLRLDPPENRILGKKLFKASSRPLAAPDEMLECRAEAPRGRISKDLQSMLEDIDAGFSETLLTLIDRTGKKDSEIYRKANIDRRLFSKIRSDLGYRPSKPTAIAFAIALELDEEDTRDLIGRAGYTLSHSSKFDIIIRYFIGRGEYDIHKINEALFAYDQSLLGA